MEEREIDKILRPKKKLTTLFIIYIIIGMIFIGVVFYMKFLGREEKEAKKKDTVLPGQFYRNRL